MSKVFVQRLCRGSICSDSIIQFIKNYYKFQVDEFFLFAGLMIVDMIVFGLMTLKYEYVEVSPSSEEEPDVQKSPLPISDSPSDNNGTLREGGDQNNHDDQNPKPEETQSPTDETKNEVDVPDDVLLRNDEQKVETDERNENGAKDLKDDEILEQAEKRKGFIGEPSNEEPKSSDDDGEPKNSDVAN